MTSIPDVLGDIADSEWGEWPKFILEEEGKIVHTHSWETGWRIERPGIHKEGDEFEEDWTDVYPAESKAYDVYIYHWSSPIWSKRVVSVDGGRAMIPVPDFDDHTISQLEEKVGLILTGDWDQFHDRRRMGDIEVSDKTI